ncbi:ROK family protein [Lacrimispora sp. 210928-DFI.3.58]|uniref:ROK family protein n=1 Tax=Lacrimispora sp. 210928-DFI.3.58 TaxID=2883214 RepID=UPI0015B3B782|nr:ROK family protein [Lacrimispora sp. 210928-DFI.3.58]MCB7317922.1 ROK family protein [Lacrimispora sp. 210928-DFI.3.58]
MLIGALEAGGTKMVCAIGKEDGTILEQVSIPTTTPEETIPKIIAYFKDKKIDALGVAAFGPVDVKPGSETYGYILDTPKLAWRHKDLLGDLRKELDVPIGLDTDVNGSCLGEVTYGCAKGLDSVIYITIGTGVGVGVWVNGKLLHGMLHPEGGHILLTRHPEDPDGGICPSHHNCLEGFASGPSIEARWGKKAIELIDKPEVWELESYYIAQALTDYIMILSPQKIILGGGVMHQEQLFPLIRGKVKELVNGYINTKELADIDNYIVPASLHDDQGIMGCIKLGLDALES